MLVWLMLVVVFMGKVYPAVALADFSDCIDGKGTPWHWWCRC